MRMGRAVLLAALILAGLLSACSVKLDPSITLPNIDTTLGKVALTCSAMVEPTVGSVVPSGQAVPVNLKATGGIAPYQVVDTAIGFTKETVLSRTYTNTGNANQIQVDTVVIKDSLGLVSQCNFLVTVAPTGVTPSTLACTLAGTPTSPVVSQDVDFVATASGGSAPYTFSQFDAGSNSTLINPLAPTSATTAAAKAKYTASGWRTASVKLTDSTGTPVTCSQQINAIAAPAVSVIASPSATVVMGSPLTLTATPSGFSTPPTYSFTTTRAGVTITSTGAIATVNSSTAQSDFNVTVTATAGAQVASQTISLAFTSSSSLACSITHPSGLLYVDDTVKFDVVAANGEALLITYFGTHSDGTAVAQTDSSRSVKYTVAGIKNVLVQARSIATGALCQAGGVMSDTIEITPAVIPPLTCSAYTSSNPTFTYQYFTAFAAITGGQGSRGVESLTVTQNSGSQSSVYEGNWVDSTSVRIRILYPGTYQIKLTVKDNYGHSGSCTTAQIVW